MFGVVVASLDSVSDEEKARYQQMYCGLCHSLKKRFGQVSRFCVSYDMAFLAMLLESIYESGEERLSGKCVVHPGKQHLYLSGRFVDYAADMSLVLAYHKCIDNWVDEKSASSLAYSKALLRGYREAEERYGALCSRTEQTLGQIRVLEGESMNMLKRNPNGDAQWEDPDSEMREGLLRRADEIARLFGSVMGEMFSYHDGYWREDLAVLGFELGRFVYFMDAAIDRQDDRKDGSYNPFNVCRSPDDDIAFILNDAIGAAARAFEKLPLEKDLNLLRSVLYSGVWQKLNIKERESVKVSSVHGQESA